MDRRPITENTPTARHMLGETRRYGGYCAGPRVIGIMCRRSSWIARQHRAWAQVWYRG